MEKADKSMPPSPLDALSAQPGRRHSFKGELTRFATRLAHPAAFAIVAIYGVGWYVFDRKNFDWSAAATLAIWFMTLFIQRAALRDTQAIHAKLDELLKAAVGARSDLAHIDSIEPEEIEQHRRQAREELTELLTSPDRK